MNMAEETVREKTIAVLGLGCAGVRVVNLLSRMPEAAHLRLLAVDTDSEALDGCPLPEENKLLADRQWRNGRGCGGDVLKGQRSMARERAALETLISDSKLLLVIGGLGGGTASGGAPALAGLAGRLKIPTIFLLTMPFSLEGHSKRKISEDTLQELLPVVDVLLCLPNDLLFSVLPAETSTREAFRLADLELARSVVGVSELLRVGNLLPADFGDLRTVLRERKSFCAIGVGNAAAGEGLNVGQLALERLLEAPLLGGVNKLRDADVVVLTLLGGEALSLGEMKAVFEAARRFIGEDANVVIGTNVDPAYGDRIQLTALAIKYDGKVEAVRRPVHRRRAERPAVVGSIAGGGQFEQPQFELEPVSRGIFLNTTQVVVNGEDLDIPTFQRRSVAIDKGE
ncbi:hypothetical protein [Victivallis sp. Marseille-Q1083]|uniref:hypothetical protein n=1 Tax=Victivallis sp. Marseille-Q1083 TaxID=2717288 RepID=UPI00158EBBC5|nr:hypothetical protein [Victivallis sp. Marseille-Q1083]